MSGGREYGGCVRRERVWCGGRDYGELDDEPTCGQRGYGELWREGLW